MWFTRVSLHNPVLATMAMLAFVVLGLFSLQRMEVDQFPNVDLPVVVVTTQYPGASPAIVESEVTKKIEEAVNSIAGINSLYSRTYESLSVVIIEFQLYVDGRTAADDVREKIGQVQALLRDDVEEPAVERFDPESLPIWAVAVLPQTERGTDADGPSSVEITSWADQVLKKRLENVRGVGAVNLVGATRRQIHLDLRPADLDALGVTPDQVIAAVRGENQDQPLGTLQDRERELVVQLPGRMQRPADFNRIIVARSSAGTPIYLQDVATVSDAAEEPESLALYNGRRTVLASIQKTQDANTIQVVDDLNATLQTLQDAVPPDLQLVQVNDSSRPIRVAVQNVRQTLIEGGVLTVLIVFLFLNSWRSTIITGLTLPISIIGTFFFMQVFGFTVNLITLMALSLCVGLLIDDAIVVRENIVRHGQMGKSAWDAAMEGTQEIGMAVLATTLSIVAVFLPIGFMQGIIGKFFHEFGITIVAAVLISMFVAFTLDPMLSSVWYDPAIHQDPGQPGRRTLYDRTLGRITAAFDRFTSQLAHGYQWLLRHALAHRFLTLLVTVAIFALSVAMLRLLGTEFVPKADFSETTFAFDTPQGSSLQATEAKARRVSRIIRSQPEVVDTLTSINTAAAQGKTSASIHVRLKPRSERERGAEELAGDLRQRLLAVPGITLTQSGLMEPVGGQKQIEFSLQGPDQQQLERLAGPLMQQFAQIPGLVDLDSSSKPDKPSVDVVVRANAASSLGLSNAQIAAPLRTLIAGTNVGNWRAPDDQTYDIIARLAPHDRSSAGDLQRLPLVTGVDERGNPVVVRLNQVADLVPATQTNQINRRSMLREIEFTGNSYGRGVGEISADIRRILDQTALPPGYSYSFSGATKNMEESFDYALQALALAVIFIYMILASQFKSFIQPLALMTALPLTLIGVVIALLLFGSSMSMFSIIGIIMLMGLVTKNAILLVDFAIRAREGRAGDGAQTEPLPREQALLAAARVRLRPILMTTLAMVFGMMPLAFATSEGAEQRAPMGQAVIGGVITSSLLTLVVVPVVYCYLDDLASWLKRILGRKQQDPHNPAPPP